MKYILEKLTADDRGLLLFDMPTGSGKTYSIADYIATHIEELAANHSKIIYITPLKKNFPIDEIKKHLQAQGKSDYWDSEVIVVEPTEGLLIKYFDDIKSGIEFSLPNFNTSSISRAIARVKHEKKLHSDTRDFLKAEAGKLANHIKEELQKETPEKRLEKIKNESKWQWVSKLFPASLTEDRTVIIMSVSKAVYPYNTIVRPVQPLTTLLKSYDVKLVIDEFDASKNFLQKFIIDYGIKTAIEPIPLVSQVSARLRESSFPDRLLPEQVLDKQPVTANESQAIFKEDSDKIVKRFHLGLSIKMRDYSDRSAFLFHDSNSYHLADARHHILTLETDISQNTLWINKRKFKDSNTQDEEYLSSLLAFSNSFIQRFKSIMSMMANNYFYSNQLNHVNSVTFDNALNSYLDFFHLPETTVHQLIDEIRLSRLRLWRDDKAIQHNSDKGLPEVQLYEQGFVHHTIADSEDHAGRSRIYTNSFPCTAELLLLDWCRHFMVVGVSATARIPSILGNYDVNYIEKSLKLDAQADKERTAKIHRIPETDKAALYAHFGKSIADYDKVDIRVQAFDNPLSQNPQDFEMIEILTQLIGDAEFVEHAVFIPIKQSNPKSYYHELNQLSKICKNWRYYLDNDIHAFLLLFGKSYKENELDFIKKVLTVIAGNHPTRKLSESEVYNEVQSIFGIESDEQLNNIQKHLAQGERRFVLSAYATIGAGKNIQYDAPDARQHELVKTNAFVASTKTDFDAIYLDKPTNVLTWTGNPNFDHKDLAKHIFELEYLKLAGLTRTDFKAYLNKAFHAFNKNPNHWEKVSDNIYDLPPYRLHVMQILIQAIGRICRTNMKSPRVHVCFDERIAEAWVEDVGDAPQLPEFKQLNHYIANEMPIPEAPMHEMDNAKINLFIDQCIKAFGNGKATSKMVAEWQQVREMVLKAPMTKQPDTLYKMLYVNFAEAQSHYAYFEENDYHDVEIVHRKVFRAKQASAYDVDIAEMMKYEFIKSHFEARGYATEFKKAKYWLSPIVYNNIYKGALGEEVGKCLWEYYNLPCLQALPVHQFELFDYRVSEAVFVDFKHWKLNAQHGDSVREKIFAKMDKVSAKLVFIINILERTDNLLGYFQTEQDGKTIIEVPSFIDSDAQRLKDITYFQQLIEAHNENQ